MDAAVAVPLKKKLEVLKDIILSLKKVLVAYSGGVDSTFLLKVCASCLSDNVLAVTAVSPTYTKKELRLAKQIACDLGVSHKIIHTDELDNPNFKANPQNRCYFCKLELFSKLKKIAKQRSIPYVLDGSNSDDLGDYRPGRKAKNELGIRSPLEEAGLSKSDIRKLSKELGLKTWDASSGACLASRFAYGGEINKRDLEMIEKAESYLQTLGFKMARVRHYRLSDSAKLARIEVDKRRIKKVISHKLAVISHLKKLGYNYVTIDLEGYRLGSMNMRIKR